MLGGRFRFGAFLALAAAVVLQVGVGTDVTRADGATKSVVNGDVDCDVDATVIDAAIVLQFDAGLVSSMACQENSDVNGDGTADSQDSLLVLQYDVALLDTLARMALEVSTPSGVCRRPAVCSVPAGSEFGLTVVLDRTAPDGIIAFQSEIFLDELAYHPTALPEQEVVWPDSAYPVRALPDDPLPSGAVAHGALSSLIPPFPVSDYAGPLVEITMSCPAGVDGADVVLLAYEEDKNPLGTWIMLPDRTQPPSLTLGRQDVDLDLDGDFDGVGNHQEMNVLVADRLQVECSA